MPDTMKIKLLYEDSKIMTRGSAQAAGYDLCAHVPYEECDNVIGDKNCIIIPPHETRKIGTGIAAAIPECHFGGIFARSGLATKEGLRPANGVGVVDSDYRGELVVALYNDSGMPRYISDGERIAQLIIIPCLPVELSVTDELDDTDRGDGGFGSTGVQ